ncbi:MAG: transporter [bacterium]|nr:transporter [bacterium]
MFAGILIVVIFLIFAALMMTRKLPALLALPAMAVVVGLVAGVFYDWSNSESTLGQFIFDTVLTQGSVKLAQAMMFAAFGSILSQVVMRSGIATRLISLTAEYAGRHKFWLALILTLMTAVCFSSVTGLGAVIMIGSLVLPIMMGVGLSASFSAGLMLLAIALGGIFNPVNLGFYVDVLKLPQDTVQSYVLVYGILLSVTTLVFLGVGMWRERGSFNWAESAELPKSRASLPSLITPVLPVLLIFVFNMPIIPAFVVGIIWGILTTEPKKAVNNLSAAVLEGLKDIAPVLGLFIGIGMCLAAMTAEPTRLVMEPLLQAIIPQTPWAFVLIFFVLAPMALYRGPLNMYGLGAGVASILLGSSILPPTAILAAFFSVGQVQGVCDPTNTHNVWLAQFTKVNADKLLKTTLPYVWAFVGVALAWAAFVADALG